MVQPLWKIVWRFLKKLNIELPYYSAIQSLGIYLEKVKTLIQRDTCSPVFISSVQISLSVVSDSLRPHEPKHARPPCPSPTLRVYPNSYPSSQ